MVIWKSAAQLRSRIPALTGEGAWIDAGRLSEKQSRVACGMAEDELGKVAERGRDEGLAPDGAKREEERA